MRRILALLALTSAVVSTATAQSSASTLKDVLLAISNRFMVDWEKHDSAALGAVMAPEFVYVGPHGPVPRAGVLGDLSTHCNLASYKFGEPQFLQSSADSAVLIYTIHQDLTCFGQPDAPDVLNTDTFTRRGGKWLLLMTTSTPLVKQSAP